MHDAALSILCLALFAGVTIGRNHGFGGNGNGGFGGGSHEGGGRKCQQFFVLSSAAGNCTNAAATNATGTVFTGGLCNSTAFSGFAANTNATVCCYGRQAGTFKEISGAVQIQFVPTRD